MAHEDEKLVRLSRKTMRRMAKPKAGFDVFATQLIELARRTPSLQPRSFDADAALEELRAYYALWGVVTKAKQQYAMALQTRFQHGSALWKTMLDIYAHAQIEAKYDLDVKYAIAEFVAFMKPKKRRARRAA